MLHNIIPIKTSTMIIFVIW